MSELPSGSAVERAMRCAASVVLPRAGLTGEAAEAGSANHGAIVDGDRSKPVVQEILSDATDVRHEVAYALNIETRSVRELGVNIGRNYGKLDANEIALTVDLECRKQGTWWAVDWKSRERVTQARDNWQIRCEVMAVMGRHGADTSVGALAYLDDSELDAAPFDAFHVAQFWTDLSFLVKRIRGAREALAKGEQIDVAAGAWCKYCPAIPHCPAHTKLAKALLGELEGIDEQVQSLTVEQCGRAWELLKRYDAISDRVKDSIRTRARHEPIPVSGGKRLMLVESSRRSLDTKKAAELLGANAPYKASHYTQVREVLAKGDE